MGRQSGHGDGDRGGRGRLPRRDFGQRRPKPPPRRHADATPWDRVASWYDRLVGEEGSDYHRNAILPAAARLLQIAPGERVLDLCCGQGVFCRMISRQAGHVLGIDASRQLVEAAVARGVPPNVRYEVADAADLGPLADGTFDAAACLMAVQDLADVGAAFASLAAALREGGRAVIVMMHPCFRVPRQSSWGWDAEKKLQYRRIDAYATPNDIPITTHPGAGGGEQTTFFHRPLAHYLSALGSAGLGVVACEELLTHRVSEPGGHSRGENRAKREFPLFLALLARKLAPKPPAAPETEKP